MQWRLRIAVETALFLTSHFPPEMLPCFLDFVLTDSTGVNHLHPHVGAKILMEKIRAELTAGVEKSGRSRL
jgi:hypothetical protein